MAATGIEVFNFLVAGIFLGLLVASTYAYLDRPVPQRRDIALMFWVLAVSMWGWAFASLTWMPLVALQVTYALAAAHPWMLMRLIGHFAPRQRTAEGVAIVGFMGTAVAMVFYPANAMPWPMAVVLYAWFLGAEFHACRSFYVAGKGMHAGLRARLVMASWATGTMIALLLVAAVWEAVPSGRDLTEPLVLIITLVLVGLYIVAFLPPPGLRRLWHQAAVTEVLDRLPEYEAEPELVLEAWRLGVEAVLDRDIAIMHGDRAPEVEVDPERPLKRCVASLGDGVWAVADRRRPEPFPEEVEATFHQLAAEGTRRLQASQANRQRAMDLARIAELEKFKSDLLRTMGHELGNPLSPIRIQVAVLSRRGLDEDSKRSLATIDRNVTRLQRLVKEMRESSDYNVARVQLDMQQACLAQLCQAAADAYRPMCLESGLDLTIDLPDRAPAHVDAGKVGQVLDNLLSNAVKYSKGGTRVHLRLEAGDAWMVHVQDEGLGMDQDQLRRLFRPFTRLHNEGQSDAEGTGMGLAIARAYAKAHGGDLHAVSPGPGQGSTFTLTIPTSPPWGDQQRSMSGQIQ